MALIDELSDALKEAMKAKDKPKLDAIRQVQTEIAKIREQTHKNHCSTKAWFSTLFSKAFFWLWYPKTHPKSMF